MIVRPELPPRGGAPIDSAFDLPLWLQISCCGKTLWAYNAAHLTLIEDYIRADLRQPEVKDITSKLPAWIVQAKHRDEVLRCIGKLRQCLEQC